jgi:hypothetical protein
MQRFFMQSREQITYNRNCIAQLEHYLWIYS